MKVLLLDADGVVLKKGEYFSEKFAREYSVSPEEIIPFFKGSYIECQNGTSDLKEAIEPYLEKWGWSGRVEEFLEYWFEDVVIDPEIEPVLAKCREQGISVYMASNNEHYRARKIEELLGDKLDGYFFSADLKVRKNNPKYFQLILEQLDVPASEVAYVDNDKVNIEAAKEIGIAASLYGERVWDELFPIDKATEFKNVI